MITLEQELKTKLKKRVIQVLLLDERQFRFVIHSIKLYERESPRHKYKPTVVWNRFKMVAQGEHYAKKLEERPELSEKTMKALRKLIIDKIVIE